MLSEIEKNNILNEFPDIKLSYEKIIHKKVYNCDYMMAIPDGKKCFAWFRQYDNNYVCIILELDNNINSKQIKNIWLATSCFSSSICYGTIVYGTIFKHCNNQFFCIEDIFLNENSNVSGENWKNKLNIISNLLKSRIKQISYNNSFLVFGLPVITNSNDKLENELNDSIKYKISHIQYKKADITNSYYSLSYDEYNQIINKNNLIDLNVSESKINNKLETNNKLDIDNKSNNKNIILEIKPDIQNDVYRLYTFENKEIGIACIPDYKTSIMMNKLFRIIKENDDLDKLEESDDENEFENPNIDKYVDLDKSYKFICKYNKRFKKWTPINKVDDNLFTSNLDDTLKFIDTLFNKSRNKVNNGHNNNNYKKYKNYSHNR